MVFGEGEQIVAGGTALETRVRGGGTRRSRAGRQEYLLAAFGAHRQRRRRQTNATIFTGGTELVSQGGLAQVATLSRADSVHRLWWNGIGTTLRSGAEQGARGASFDALVLGGTLYATSGGLVTSAVVSQGGFIGGSSGTSLGATASLDAEQSVNGEPSLRRSAAERRTSTAAASRVGRSS